MNFFEVLALPLVATVTAFGLVLALPQRSEASRIVSDLAQRGSGGPAGALAERVVDERRLGLLRMRFLAAGWYDTVPGLFLLRCAALGLVGGALALSAGWLLHLNLAIVAGGVAAFAVGLGHLPFSKLNGAVKRRQREISRALPDLLDTLSSMVRAGLGVNAALSHAAGAVQGVLADEIRGTLTEMRMGRSRADALRAFAARVQNEEITLVVRAMVQADRLGANLSSIFDGLSAESRERRVLKAEEIAASLPVKMVLPMALFMLPALFVMIFGGVAADYYSR